ncbi:phosphatidylinositol-specific phospholipase C1-like protein [Echinicola arenosa]|nr:phosphatidylinositol-specific phospholipase C1-like protein [Echinicola arenosa]
MKKFSILGTLTLAILLLSCEQSHTDQKELQKMNELQVIGSHNSYKIGIEQPVLDFIAKKDSMTALSLAYEHIPLSDQLDLGLRNLEMDVFHDPQGGRYKHPKAIAMLNARGISTLPFDEANKLNEPGLKMFHVQDIDFRSHHLLFKDGLKELLSWSKQNPKHSPIIILINAKDDNSPEVTPALPFTAAALDSIDLEIRAVMPAEKLITPDLVRGDHISLEEAVTTNGWPALDEVRGRFLFVLDEKEVKINRYLEMHPNLQNAALFVNIKEGNPNAGFRIINDPVKNHDHIKDLVSKGYMIRTRADAGTLEARHNDYNRFEQAKSSGAQVISTDYYVPSKLFESEFQVRFEDGSFERERP